MELRRISVSTVEFAILGAGAMGSIVGAHLARAGHTVAMLARGARAQTIRRDGLHIKGLAELATPVQVITEPAQLRRAEVLIVATKAIGTATALEPLRRAEIDLAFSMQNGVMKNELLAAAFGRERVLGALANTSGELLATGEVLFTRNVNILVGELSGEAGTRAQRVARAIDASGVRSAAAADIRSLEWSKFVAWLPFAVLAVTTRAASWKFLVDPDAGLVFMRLLREVARLADACGITLTDAAMLPAATACRGTDAEALQILATMGRDMQTHAPQHRLSTLQDLEAGRPLEVEETFGYAARLAAEKGLSLPLLENGFRLVAAIDRAARTNR